MAENMTPESGAPGRTLFRPAAVEHHRRRLAGDIVVTEPRWLWRASASFFGLLLVGATLAAIWPIARVTKLEGTVRVESGCVGARRWTFEPRVPTPAVLSGRPAALTLRSSDSAPLGPIAGVFACTPQPTGVPGSCQWLFEMPCATAANVPAGTWQAEARVELAPVTLTRLVGARFIKGSDDANR
jgi:hypothetical protein